MATESTLTTLDHIQLGPLDAGRILSSDEFASAYLEEPYQYERVNGRLEVMSPDGWEHVETSEPWRDLLGAYRLARPEIVRRVVSQPWVRIDADNDRIGDIGVYLMRAQQQTRLPDLVPDPMFEFVSPSKKDRRRDYIEKRADYLKAGIQEYVIIDRFDRQVTVLTLQDGRYAERVLPADGTYGSALLPGFAVALTGIWPR